MNYKQVKTPPKIKKIIKELCKEKPKLPRMAIISNNKTGK